MDFSFVSLFCPLHIEVLSPWIGVIDPIILRGDGFDPLENSQNLQAHVRPDTFLVLPLDRRKQNWLFGWIACPEGGNLGPSADDDDEAEAEGGEGSAGHNEGGRNAEAGGDGVAEKEDVDDAGSSSTGKRKANLGGSTGRKPRRS